MDRIETRYVVVMRWRRSELLIISFLFEGLFVSSIPGFSLSSDIITESNMYKDFKDGHHFSSPAFSIIIRVSYSSHSIIVIHIRGRISILFPFGSHFRPCLSHPTFFQNEDPNLLLQHKHASHYANDRRCTHRS